MMEAEQLRRVMDAADVQLRAMVLLGLNCAFGNGDCAGLPFSAIDLDAGWVNFPRPKTGIPRRCPLWPETVAALRSAIAERPEPQEEAASGLVFVTTKGRAWLGNTVSVAARNLMKAAGVHRDGIGFYTLRHVFRTVADGTKDQPAIRLIMGHADGSIDAAYRESIDDARLVGVAEHVRRWLFAPEAMPGGAT